MKKLDIENDGSFGYEFSRNELKELILESFSQCGVLLLVGGDMSKLATPEARARYWRMNIPSHPVTGCPFLRSPRPVSRATGIGSPTPRFPRSQPGGVASAEADQDAPLPTRRFGPCSGSRGDGCASGAFAGPVSTPAWWCWRSGDRPH
jgi:hypothetical protein